jgi:hypothetical protein
VVFSPGINKWDCQAKFGPEVLFCKTWPAVLEVLEKAHGNQAQVAVFPAGAMQGAAA